MVIAAALTLAGVGLVLCARCARGPRYHGRTTAQWFRQLRTNARRYGQGGLAVYLGSGLVLRVLPDTDPAVEAMRALGTNAVPWLYIRA